MVSVAVIIIIVITYYHHHHYHHLYPAGPALPAPHRLQYGNKEAAMHRYNVSALLDAARQPNQNTKC
jgi:hypothetical protein